MGGLSAGFVPIRRTSIFLLPVHFGGSAAAFIRHLHLGSRPRWRSVDWLSNGRNFVLAREQKNRLRQTWRTRERINRPTYLSRRWICVGNRRRTLDAPHWFDLGKLRGQAWTQFGRSLHAIFRPEWELMDSGEGARI